MVSDVSTCKLIVKSIAHHAHAIPSAEFFPSGCCSPTLSCHPPHGLFSNFLHFAHRENESFEVLSLHEQSVSTQRPRRCVSTLSATMTLLQHTTSHSKALHVFRSLEYHLPVQLPTPDASTAVVTLTCRAPCHTLHYVVGASVGMLAEVPDCMADIEKGDTSGGTHKIRR